MVMGRLEALVLMDRADMAATGTPDDAARTTIPTSENGLPTQVMSHDWSFPVARNRISRNYLVGRSLPVDSLVRLLATEGFDANRDRFRFLLN